MAQRPTRRGGTQAPGPAALRSPSDASVAVEHLDVPPRFDRPARIHARRTLPLIREGVERDFHSRSTRTILSAALRSEAAARATTEDVVVFLNTTLPQPAAQRTASNVGEPSAAMSGDVVFFTGNWYAAMSSDGGRTFQFVAPDKAFAAFDPPGSQFCCDQVVNYIPAIDTFVWLLQYGPDTGDNIQRLAFARTADVVQGRWRLFDITTAILGVPGAFLDFPDLAVGANALYITTNIFHGQSAGSAVVRIRHDAIAQAMGSQLHLPVAHHVSMSLQSFRVAQNCGETAFFAAHQDTSTLALFSWPEGADTPTQSSVGVARWIGGNGYRSRCPDGHRWLDRADSRITGATQAGNELWFAWGVNARSNQRPNPFVQIARIDARNLTLVENLNLFDPDSATCYAALATNDVGDVGVSYMVGGGPRYPSHVVGVLTGDRKDVVVSQGSRAPMPDPNTGKYEWGDFLSVRRAFPDRARFCATGYTLLGPGPGSNVDSTPRFVVFGRGTAAPPRLGGSGAPPPEVTGGPILDVNTLPVVGEEVAAVIKAAAGIDQAAAGERRTLPPPAPERVTHPGVERWPVKTGQDPDRVHVGRNVIEGRDLGAGIVPATVEELVSAPRPVGMPDPRQVYNAFQSSRAAPVETTIWQIDATIIAMKLEQDGDYHLVLQGSSGETMIGEIPTPSREFIGDSPWSANIQAARRMTDDRFVRHLAPAAFVPLGGRLVPREAIAGPIRSLPEQLPPSFLPAAGSDERAVPLFKTQVPATRARITGVGFFDQVHGQMGVSQSNGIELHPVLKIEWL
jgi:hypothetical protein